MEPMNYERAEHEARKVQVNREELVERIGRAVPEDGMRQVLPGLYFTRSSTPIQPIHGLSNPAFCVIAQGSKEVLLGDTRYRYDPEHYLISTVQLPTVSQVLEASPQQPYLSLRLQLDANVVSSVVVEAGFPASR